MAEPMKVKALGPMQISPPMQEVLDGIQETAKKVERLIKRRCPKGEEDEPEPG